MHNHIFTEISLIIALGSGVALIMRALRQPLILGHIITGILAGPAVFNLIKQDAHLGGISHVGVALLFYVIGLDLSLRIFTRLSRVALFTSIVQVCGITGVGFVAARMFGFGSTESLVIGLCLALSSTIIIVKLLSDKREMTRLYAQIAVGVLLLQDVFATIAKIAAAAKTNGSESVIDLLLLAGRGAGLLLILYLVSRHVIPKLTRDMENSKELILLFALGWGLGFATVFEKSGFSIEIGALFAGMSLAGLPYSRTIASRLKPVRDFFLVIFFISLGQSLVPETALSVLWPAVIFSIIVLFCKPLLILASMGKLGYTKRSSFKAALAMSQVSEFSLVFAAAALGSGIIGHSAQSTVTLVALITFAVSAYLIKYDDRLYALLEKHLRMFERKVTKLEQRESHQHRPIILFGYQKGGPEFIRTFERMNQKYVVVDYDPEVIEQLDRHHASYLYGDATDPELLEELNLNKAKLIISTISDYQTNDFLAHWIEVNNPRAVYVCSADSVEHAAALYDKGASYVMMPHFIGSEKISNFIKKNGFKKTEFKHYREKHLTLLQTHMTVAPEAT